MWEVWISISVAAFLVFFAFVKNNLKICRPNEILIFSGKKPVENQKTVPCWDTG